MASEAAVPPPGVLSAHFSLGFPEKGMAGWCGHSRCLKAFPVLPLGAAVGSGRAGAAGTGAWTGLAIASDEKLEISLWATFFSQPGLGPLPALNVTVYPLSWPAVVR